MDTVYRLRHWCSWLPVAIAAGWILSHQQTSLKIQPRYDETTMELALVAAEPLSEVASQPDPVPAPEPATMPPEPEPAAMPPEPVPASSPEPVAPPPKPIVKPQPEPKPATKPEPQPKPVRKPKPEPVRKAAPAQTRPAASKTAAAQQPVAAAQSATAKPAASRASSAATENGWIAGLRQDLEAQKRYPTGRQASLERPEGSVEVWLEVDRSGRVLSSGIGSKTRSMLLNRAAMSSLQNIRQVKPFPAEAFAGQSRKRFTATFNYRAP